MNYIILVGPRICIRRGTPSEGTELLYGEAFLFKFFSGNLCGCVPISGSKNDGVKINIRKSLAFKL